MTIKDATARATIYYTTNGATPNSSSTKYTKAFTVSTQETVKAVAIAPGHVDCDVVSGEFTFN